MTQKNSQRLFATYLLTYLLLFASTLYAYPIPDTGQTESYTDTFGEDSDYLFNPPSYTKLDAQGNDLPDSATSWIMVRDNVTGLIWEVKTKDDSIHYKFNKYTWYDSNPATNGGTPGDGTDTEDFINAINAENFGGYGDWRVPTVTELASIANYGRHDLAIDNDYFPNSAPYYWSSTSSRIVGKAWAINFMYGNALYDDKSESFCVRAVRGSQNGLYDHFVDNGDGTVTDASTGLMWQKTPPTPVMTWEKAISYCETLSVSVYSDWRLPNTKELRSIVDYGGYMPAIDTKYFSCNSANYWSSTTAADNAAYAWIIYFHDGYDKQTPKSESIYTRAVRCGQVRLTGHLFITSPSQGTTWSTGSTMPIRWETQGISGDVRISISRNAGAESTFETIVESTENDGSYDWTVNVAASANCVLKIDPVNYPSKGASQGLFSVSGSVTLSPTVVTETPTAVTMTSATLKGTINPNGTTTNVAFQWGSNTAYGNQATALQGPLTGNTDQTVTVDLTGLTSGSTYHCRVIADSSSGTVYGDDVVFTTPVKPVKRKAIIVAGSGPYENNLLWEVTEDCVRYAYKVLSYQGYDQDAIYLLSSGEGMDLSGDGISDVNAPAENASLKNAIETWSLDAENLLIYMVGHGWRDGTFVMGEFEGLPANVLDGWLDDLQQKAMLDFVAVVYDGCYAGSFIPLLSPPPGKTRVLAASAAADEKAIFMADGVLCFGRLFFSELFRGASFYESFIGGKKSVELAYQSGQQAQLEANWNGNANEKEDQYAASEIKVGLEKTTASDLPRIAKVSQDLKLNEGETSALIFVEDVFSGNGIKKVFAVIRPPDYTGASAVDPIMDFPTVELASVGNGRYEGTYTGFTAPGIYNISIFAKDGEDFLSDPVYMKVETFSPCLFISDDVGIEVPCLEYHDKQYGFNLDFFKNPDDFLGYYWKLDNSSLKTGSGDRCLCIDENLAISLSCVKYKTKEYSFTLRFYPNSNDPAGLYWKMDTSTLAVK